ncbi:MAG: glucosamine-6-phosphate deaminase [Clostridia bacterium]|nr:glucosamine-6-phosphate deaminase [Clostridia bacterium]
MEFHVYENARAACEAAGVLIAAQITRKGDSVLGLATGSTPIPAYEMLVSWYKRGVIDFDRVRTFNLDEYVGIDEKNPLSYHAFMQEHLFSKVNLRPENVHLPSGRSAADGEAYDEAIRRAGGIDIQLLGIGRNGHIGFNEPAKDFTYGTHVVTLTEDTIEANARFFNSADDVPRQAISMGIGNIMSARCVVLVATGESKANAVYRTIRGPITPEVPASILQLHPCCVILTDREAGRLMLE